MDFLLYLAHKWHYSLIIAFSSFVYSLINCAIPALQFISLSLGVVLVTLSIYGKILEIKKMKKNEKNTQ